MNLPRLAALAVLTAFVSACSNSSQSLPATATGAVASANASAGSKDEWHRALRQNGLPAAGCFKATYPSTTWQHIACQTPPKLWFPPHVKKGLGQRVGDGDDFTADATPNTISQSIGSFPVTKDVKSVVSQGGSQGPNSYTLQLNSNFFSSAACATLPSCAGWSQFVYSNPPGSGDGALFIQDWLVPLNGKGWSQCPAGKGWQNVGFGCVQNSPGAVYIPNVQISDIGNVIETGVAASDGDSVYMSIDGTEYGMKNIQSDGITDLSTNWQGSEFNIIGNGGGGQANFNSGAKIAINIQVDDGVKTAPSCPAQSGTTGETNNLFFVKAPKAKVKQEFPSVEFMMSSKAGKTATCNTIKAAK